MGEFFKKRKERSEAYLNEYRLEIERAHKSGKIVVFSDGSADNMDQTAPIRFGFLVYKDGMLIHADSKVCNDSFNTSVKSEIMGMNAALEYLFSTEYSDDVIILSDNKWVVQYAINRPDWMSTSTDKAYFPAFIEIRKRMKWFKSVVGIWIPRELNTLADDLSKGAEVLAQNQVKRRAHEIRDHIKSLRAELLQIQEKCSHENTEKVDYSWRAGASSEESMCSDCFKILSFASRFEVSKQ